MHETDIPAHWTQEFTAACCSCLWSIKRDRLEDVTDEAFEHADSSGHEVRLIDVRFRVVRPLRTARLSDAEYDRIDGHA